MATHIIKEGQKKFIATCPTCGCQFEYEIEDLTAGFVTCPCCNNNCKHQDQSIQPPSPNYGQICDGTWGGTSVSNCETCDWYKKMLSRGEPYIGDSPCDWCSNKRFIATCHSMLNHTDSESNGTAAMIREGKLKISSHS